MRIRTLVVLMAYLIPLLSYAVGIGSQSWGDSAKDEGGGSNMTIWDALWILSVYAGCWWTAFSSKSPIANLNYAFLWQMFFFLFAPAIICLIGFST